MKSKAKDLQAEVERLRIRESMWRGRAMELLADYCDASGANYRSILERWEYQERQTNKVLFG